MNIQDILSEYDQMFGNNSLDEIENYLLTQYNKAIELELYSVQFTLLNEIIGFFRDVTKKNEALYHCDLLLQLLETMVSLLDISLNIPALPERKVKSHQIR